MCVRLCESMGFGFGLSLSLRRGEAWRALRSSVWCEACLRGMRTFYGFFLIRSLGFGEGLGEACILCFFWDAWASVLNGSLVLVLVWGCGACFLSKFLSLDFL